MASIELLSTLAIDLCVARNSLPDHTEKSFLSECLSVTNGLREKHQVSSLTLNQKIVSYAKSRCNLISREDKLSHGHSGLKGYGENLFWSGSSSLQSCKTAVQSWYNEVNKYDFKNPGFSMKTGHFTQLVWKTTTDVGCARCGGKGGQWFETYIVCNYSPAGNYKGQYSKNVMQLKK